MRIFLCICLIVIPSALSAQSWFEGEPRWTIEVGVSNFVGPPVIYLEEMVITGDSLINGKLCKQFHRTWLYYLYTDTEEKRLEAVRVFPNPVGDQLFLEIPPDTRITGIEMIDLAGRVQVLTVLDGQVISLAGHPPGVYWLRLLLRGRQPSIHRLVKQ